MPRQRSKHLPAPIAPANLTAGVPIFRPGSGSPGSNSPYLPAPLPSLPGPPPRAPRARLLRRSLRACTAEGIAAEIVTASAGGAVLTAWGLYLGGHTLVIGVLGALPFLAQFIHLPAAWLTSWLGRRRVALVAVAISRQVYLPLVALPFLPVSQQARLATLIAVAAAAAVLGVIGNNAWVAWMGDLVPESVRGRYFGRRTALCTLGGTAAGLASGMLLDLGRSSGRTGPVLALLAALACVAGALTTWLMSLQHDEPPRGEPEPLDLKAAARPFTDRDTRRILTYQVSWNLAVGLAGPFFAVHMLQNLEMGFALIAVQSAGVAAARIFAVPLWGRALDRVGAKPILVLCSFGIAGIPLIWLFPTPGMLWPLAIDAVLSGILWSGHALASFALPLAVAPRRGRPFYLGAFSAAGGLGFAIAAGLGGALGEAVPRDLLVLGHPMYGLQLLFVLSALARLLAAGLALRIVEPGADTVDSLLKMARDRAALLRRRPTPSPAGEPSLHATASRRRGRDRRPEESARGMTGGDRRDEFTQGAVEIHTRLRHREPRLPSAPPLTRPKRDFRRRAAPENRSTLTPPAGCSRAPGCARC